MIQDKDFTLRLIRQLTQALEKILLGKPEESLKQKDLDLDFFSKDVSYINDCKKLKFVQSLIDNAKAIFVATSPFFIEFDAAKRIVEILDWQRR